MIASAFDAVLQGQSQGSSTWKTGNIDNWNELDSVPCRVAFGNGPASNQVIVLQFDHSTGIIPAIQNLADFSNSDNVVIRSGPILSAPPGQDAWSYTVTVDVTDNTAGFMEFKARLAAGAHLIQRSALSIQGSGSLGTLALETPNAGSDVPDLVVIKTGPLTAAPGEVITYTLNYYNKPTAPHHTDGVQLSDRLPSEVTYVPGSATGSATLVGNTLSWDLPNLDEGAGGSVTYQVQVNSDLSFGQSFHNFAQIYSSDNDADYTDNSSSVTTTLFFNRVPRANDDSYTVNENDILSVPSPGVMANDVDADGKPLTASLVSGPAYGMLSFSASGAFTYIPLPHFNGMDSFTYKVSNGQADSARATVTLIVNPVNDAPLAKDDSYSVNEDTTLNVGVPGVLANDSDVDGDSLTAVLVEGPTHGTLTLGTNGSFVYSPALNFNGADQFKYKANDGTGDSSPATVTITVIPVNDPPAANPDHYVTDEDTPLIVPGGLGVLANDIDVDGDTLEALLMEGSAHGIISLNADGSFIYTPSLHYSGTDSFSYQANDGFLESAVMLVTITIRPVNHAPIARSDTYSLEENQFLSVSAPGVLSNDTDLDGDPLEASLVTGPAHGTIRLNADGSFIYTPTTNYTGADIFTYQADDGILESAVASVNITVRRANQPPIVNIISPTNGTVYFAPASITLIAEAYDLDGSVRTIKFFQVTNLLAQTNLVSSYVVLTNVRAGEYQFSAMATDNDGASALSPAVSVTVLERPPSFALQPVHFNPQTGLFEEIIRISNPSQKVLEGARVVISNLRAGAAVFNASGKTNGLSYVQTILPIQAGQSIDLRIEYYVPDFLLPEPILTMEVVPPSLAPAPPTGSFVPVTRQLRLPDGSFLVEFNSISGGIYFLQYSSDLATWRTAWPSVHGLGTRVQWVDNGAPRTESLPMMAPCRFYRVLLAP